MSLRARAALGLLLSCGCSLRSLEELPAEELPAQEPAAQQSQLRSGPCPDEMLEIAFSDGGTFCIDRRETTRGEFDEFLSAPPAALVAQQGAGLCPELGILAPGDGADCAEPYQLGVAPELPVSCVSLCEAMAYCQSRGKRLCGGRGGQLIGEPELREALNDPDRDEWYTACAGNGELGRAFPYGSEFDAGACNTSGAAPAPPASAAACSTPEGVFDLSGNLSEWALACRRPRGLRTMCLVRGGEYRTLDAPQHAQCAVVNLRAWEEEPPRARVPSDRSAGVGIRCCSD